MTTADIHPTDALVPRVLWAQRKDKVYVTIEVFEVKDEKLVLTENSLQFNGTRSEDNAKFAVSLEFYSPIDVEKSQKNVNPRNISLVLYKQDETVGYWPRLIKDVKKVHYIAIDFSKWVDEDEEGHLKDDFMNGMGDFSNFDPSQFSNMNYSDGDDGGEGDDGEDGDNIDDGEDELELDSANPAVKDEGEGEGQEKTN